MILYIHWEKVGRGILEPLSLNIVLKQSHQYLDDYKIYTDYFVKIYIFFFIFWHVIIILNKYIFYCEIVLTELKFYDKILKVNFKEWEHCQSRYRWVFTNHWFLTALLFLLSFLKALLFLLVVLLVWFLIFKRRFFRRYFFAKF